MRSYNHILSAGERELLRSQIGKKLEWIEGHRIELLDDDTRTTFNRVARMHFADNTEIDLQSEYVRVDITDNFWDDTGVFSIYKSEGKIQVPYGVTCYRLNVGRVIEEIHLVDDLDDLYCKGIHKSTYSFTRALILKTKDNYLRLSMDEFEEDNIVIQFAKSFRELIPDKQNSWYEETGWNDVFRREVLML